jgi:hypothetical protein
MGRLLDIVDKALAEHRARPAAAQDAVPEPIPAEAYVEALASLEARVPDYVDRSDWELAVTDAKAFLGQWGERAQNLGWTAGDLFGLHPVPDCPAPNYRRLSRYDQTGLVWLLRGRNVVALSEGTAAIRCLGGTLVYRRFNKPAYGPIGDSLDDLA